MTTRRTAVSMNLHSLILFCALPCNIHPQKNGPFFHPLFSYTTFTLPFLPFTKSERYVLLFSLTQVVLRSLDDSRIQIRFCVIVSSHDLLGQRWWPSMILRFFYKKKTPMKPPPPPREIPPWKIPLWKNFPWKILWNPPWKILLWKIPLWKILLGKIPPVKIPPVKNPPWKILLWKILLWKKHIQLFAIPFEPELNHMVGKASYGEFTQRIQ